MPTRSRRRGIPAEFFGGHHDQRGDAASFPRGCVVSPPGRSALLVVVSAPAANASISWSAADPPLPANAVPGGGLTIASSSCPADGWCIGVGNYMAVTAGNYYTAGLIVSESGGTWTATESPLPGNAATDPQAFLQAVTCTGVGSCVAVGRYLDTSGATQGLVEELSNGDWAPSEVSLPANALATGPPRTRSCRRSPVRRQVGAPPWASTARAVQSRRWSTPTSSVAGAPRPRLCPLRAGIAIPRPGVPRHRHVRGHRDLPPRREHCGLRRRAVRWDLGALDPSSAVGHVLRRVDRQQRPGRVLPCRRHLCRGRHHLRREVRGLLDTLSGGTWSAVAVPLPDGPSTDVQLTSVACTDPNTCVVTGFDSVSGVEQGLLESLASGSWRAPPVAPTPSGTPVGDVELNDVVCPAAGTCVADGQIDVDGAQSGLFWNLSSGVWSVTATPLPADAASSSDPYFAPIACPGAGVCLAVGTYLGTSGSREGVIETDPSLAATTTTVSAQRVSGPTISFSATVVGSAGPTGTVTFSSGLEPLCTATISNGTATCTGPQPTAGTILGSYSGDGASAPSWGTAASPAAPSTIVVLSGSGQSAKLNGWFSTPLIVEVTNSAGAGSPEWWSRSGCRRQDPPRSCGDRPVVTNSAASPPRPC